MWYYYTNDQQFGPVDEEEIIRLIQNGTIGHDAFLWTEGFDDWMPAGQTQFSNELANIPATAITRPVQTAYPYPAIRFQPHSLRTLWLWLAWLVGIGLPLSFVCIGVPLTIAGTVLGYILLYRSWLLIQDGNPRTTAGLAVGFCFIPFFNLYWIYVAFVGLSKDMNSYCRQRQIAAPVVSENMALAYYILSLLNLLAIPLSFIPDIGIVFSLLVGIPITVLYIILMKHFTDTGMSILEHKMQTAAQPQTTDLGPYDNGRASRDVSRGTRE
ncbi:MAG: DUF4339 domain-containing protein [Sedimentisphaerales bacterium]|nr:DUF4339 domain-containing protein [Sedimentisphaerales bacterium]